MTKTKTNRIVGDGDFSTEQIEKLNRDYGFNIVIGDEFIPGKHCGGAEPLQKSVECGTRTCYGVNGALNHVVIETCPCEFYGYTN